MTASHQLYLLHCGWLDDPAPDGGTVRIPVPAYLIRSATGRNYLVDTGNPAALLGANDCQPWYPAPCQITPADDPIARLGELGLTPLDIYAIIATHFDFDHAGRYDAFGPLGTDVFVQRSHLGAALSDPDRYPADLWNVPGLRWQRLDGEVEIEPGLSVIRTDGHAEGHQSVMVLTVDGWVILAADAIDSQRFVDTRSFPGYYDVARTNASIDRLLGLAKDFDAVLLYGHDREQWEHYPHSPAPFRRT
jgi:N-acyl homoserine lactone hydrolase